MSNGGESVFFFACVMALAAASVHAAEDAPASPSLSPAESVEVPGAGGSTQGQSVSEEFNSGDGESAAPPPSFKKGVSQPSEAEGTRARDRFQVPEVRRSPYTYKGQPLEVDPD